MNGTQTARKAFAGYEDHDACVRDNQDKEDPDAFCQWLKEQGKDALSDPNAETVLTGLTTEFVSSVDRPAQDSEWLIFKDADTPRRKAAEVERPYVFADSAEVAEKAADVDVREENDDGERQIAYAAVLIPNRVDKQGDVIPPYVVERAAHEYMAEYRKMDSDHDLDDGAGVPVESWILKEEQEFDLPDGGTVTYPEGTWVIGKRFVDDEWERVKSGELNGFSIYGGAQPVDVGELAEKVDAVNRRATKGVDASNPNRDMKNALQDAASSDTPAATLADRVQAAKAELPDEDAEQVVEMLRASASVLEESMGDGGDGGGDPPEGEDDEDEDEVEESAKDQPDDDNQNMTNDDTPDDGGDTNDGGDAVADGIDELKSMVKGVDDKVDDFDDRLSEVEDEVDTLKSAIDDDVPNDRMDNGDVDDDVPENERMKSVAKQAATEAVAEVAGVEDADDPDVVRKGLREQVGAGAGSDDVDADLPSEDYSGVVDDDGGSSAVSKSTGTDGNTRLVGGDD